MVAVSPGSIPIAMPSKVPATTYRSSSGTASETIAAPM